MEPPAKRMRLGQAPYDDDDGDEANLDELSMDPIKFDARQDPLYELDKGRAKAASRLKSAFERIFEKYERDFTDVGDEIDLETGEVIVNNGHLLSLEDEKVRNREGSISSDEEERIMRGKETNSVEASHTKPSVQATLSTHPPLGFPTGTSQQLMAHPQFSSPGIPPNPYGFMDPFMGHGPADPLWQAPDLPMPLYQDRFGFIGQSMGYPPSFGYGYGPMLAPGGSFGHGSFGDFFHPQAPKKLPPAKTPARQLLPRLTSDADDSEEDDVLLGSNTEEVVKSVSIKSVKALPSAVVSEKAKQAAPKDVKSISTAGKEKDTQKPRRGRPKKAAVPAKPPESDNEANKERGSKEATSSTETLNPMEPTDNPIITPGFPSPPSSKGPVVKENVDTEITQTEASTTVITKTPTEEDTLGSQRRRSSRGRKQTEFYGQIKWTKSRQPNPVVANTQSVTEGLADEPSDSLPLETDGSLEHVRPEDSLYEDTMELDLDVLPEEIGNKDCANETDVVVPNQEYHEEPPVNIGEPDGGEVIQNTPTNLQPVVQNLEQPDALFSTGESTDKIKTSLENKEMPPSDEPGKPNDLSNEELLVHLPEDTAQDTTSTQLDIEEPKLEGLITEDTTDRAVVETISPNLVDKEHPVAIEETFESNPISDDRQETPQSPTTQIQLEAADQLADPVQEHLSPEPEVAESEIAESEIAEAESTESEMPLKSTPSRPSLTEDSDPLSLPDEDEPTLPPARLPTSHQSKIPGLFEKAELALRPQVAPKGPRTKITQRKSVSSSKSPSPSKQRPSQSAKPSTLTPVPSTPKKKRRDSNSQTETSHGTASARKKYALTSLVPDDPDEDDDELSVLASSVAPSPFLSSYSHSHSHFSSSKPHPRFNARPSPAATPRKTGRRHGFLTGPASTSSASASRSALRTPHRINKRGAPPATDSRASRGPKLRFDSGVQSSPLARTVMSLNHHHRESSPFAATPSSRRGGEDKGRNRDRDRDEVGSVELGSSPVRTPGGTARRCGEDGFVCERDFCFTCCK